MNSLFNSKKKILPAFLEPLKLYTISHQNFQSVEDRRFQKIFCEIVRTKKDQGRMSLELLLLLFLNRLSTRGKLGTLDDTIARAHY
jgi:hypothetical protein